MKPLVVRRLRLDSSLWSLAAEDGRLFFVERVGKRHYGPGSNTYVVRQGGKQVARVTGLVNARKVVERAVFGKEVKR